ncbi:MAG: AmmeMemoRadiSam system radical SAM enzyme [Desulfovibrionaceae bacterium]|nr:AmmeMemoRadiSam system radical SAM enzyme [Desulfovibrionaceae bacterium]
MQTDNCDALLWEALPEEKPGLVRCRLCRHFCRIAPGGRGICGVRENIDGRLRTLTARRAAAVNLDPVEKKPLYHFYPGSYTLSLGTEGCNFSCLFCQNHALAHIIKTEKRSACRGQPADPAGIVGAALRSGAGSISYTYSEPTVFFELMLKTASLAAEHGLKNIMVSNGWQSEECLLALKDCIHAVNFDLKAFSENFYRKMCGASLEPVLDNLRRAVELGWWLEITTLLIPGENDSDEELYSLASFIRSQLGRDVPWHISRYHPAYKLKIPPTSTRSLERALQIGREAGLHYVYIGNLAGHEGENTCCPGCGWLLVRRVGYDVEIHTDGACPGCGETIPGRGWS